MFCLWNSHSIKNPTVNNPYVPELYFLPTDPPPFRFLQNFLKSAWVKITDVSHCALCSKSWMRGLFILWILHLSTHWIFFLENAEYLGKNVINTLVRYNTAKYELLTSCLKRPKIKQYTFYSVNTSNMKIMNALPNSLVFLLNDKSSNFSLTEESNEYILQ